jgi:hypothetical protein
VLGVLGVAFVVAAVIGLWPKPLPPPAESAQEAVSGFWGAVVEGDFEGATVYAPFLVDRYGSRKQAANFLAKMWQGNPPTVVREVSALGPVPDSSDLLVSYEVVRRSGSPITGQALVQNTGDPKRGYVIAGGI